MVGKTENPVNILLVEDSPGDVRLTVEALKEANMHNRLSVVEDGVKAFVLSAQGGDL